MLGRSSDRPHAMTETSGGSVGRVHFWMNLHCFRLRPVCSIVEREDFHRWLGVRIVEGSNDTNQMHEGEAAIDQEEKVSCDAGTKHQSFDVLNSISTKISWHFHRR